ncbi:MAG: DUF445 domain-containing protein [Acidimicrobiia bacterium]|nr:DUF445 domain-containing protein [Acidimicrobiia bacterium]
MTTSSDQIALEELRIVRRRATMLLGLVALVFVATFWMPDTTATGFLRAFAEAGMIGGLADWFAVVALFRHPLGIPIPHTAIIPNSKEGLGRNLATFIVRNFLDPSLIAERLDHAEPARSLGRWLTDPDNARAVSGQVAAVAAGLAEGLASDEVRTDLERVLKPQLGRLPYAEIGSRILETTVQGGHHRPLIDAGIRGIVDAMVTNRAVLRRRLGDESPWWVPEQLDDAVFDRAFGALVTFLLEVAADPEHPLRKTVEAQLSVLSERLENDHELNAQVAARMGELIETPEVGEFIDAQWRAIATAVAEAAERPESELRESIAVALSGFGHRLSTDETLAERVDGWIVSVAGPVAGAARREIGTLIEVTVDRWDTRDASRRLEIWMGRDLQFVRVNGTLVGGLAGLLIHAAVLGFGG